MPPKTKKSPKKGASGMNIPGLVRNTIQTMVSMFSSLPDNAKDEVIQTLSLLRPVIQDKEEVSLETKTVAGNSQKTTPTSKIAGWDRSAVKAHSSANWLRDHAKDKGARNSDEGRRHSALISAMLAAESRGRNKNIPEATRLSSINALSGLDEARLLWPTAPEAVLPSSERGQPNSGDSNLEVGMEGGMMIDVDHTLPDSPVFVLDKELIKTITSGSDLLVNDKIVIARKIKDKLIICNDEWVDITTYSHHHECDEEETSYLGPKIRNFVKGRSDDYRQLQGKVFLRGDGVLIAVLPKNWDDDPAAPFRKRARGG